MLIFFILSIIYIFLNRDKYKEEIEMPLAIQAREEVTFNKAGLEFYRT